MERTGTCSSFAYLQGDPDKMGQSFHTIFHVYPVAAIILGYF